MSIQSTINQGLSVAALLVSQNPEIKAASEKRLKLAELSKREKTQKEAEASVAAKREQVENSEEGTREEVEGGYIYHPTMKEQAADRAVEEAEIALQDSAETLAKERFELDPSIENYEAFYAFRESKHMQDVISERGEAAEFSRRRAAELKEKNRLAARQAEVEKSRRIASILEGVPGLPIDFERRT